MKTKFSVPAHLNRATKRWFEKVCGDYELEDHHHRLLQLAAEAWDEGQAARKKIKDEGMTIVSRFGEVKPHPCVAIVRDSRIVFARLMRELNLDVEQPDDTRPPHLRY